MGRSIAAFPITCGFGTSIGYHCGHGKEVRTPMRFMMIAVLGLVLALSASPAFAFGGGGGHSAAVSSGPTTSGGGSTSVSGSTTTGGSVAATSEPLAMFAVGLGLLGARFLRRR